MAVIRGAVILLQVIALTAHYNDFRDLIRPHRPFHNLLMFGIVSAGTGPKTGPNGVWTFESNLNCGMNQAGSPLVVLGTDGGRRGERPGLAICDDIDPKLLRA